MIVLNESTKGFLGKGRGWTVRILMKNIQIVKIRPRRVIMKAPGAVRNGCGIRLGMEGAGNNNTSMAISLRSISIPLVNHPRRLRSWLL